MRLTWAGVMGLLTVAAAQAGCARPLSVPDAAAPSPVPPVPPGPADGGSPALDAGADGAATPMMPPPTNLPAVGLCEPSGWCWENPLPQGQDIVAIWGASSDDVWASTSYGRLLRRTPAGWTQVDTMPGFSASE